MIKVRSAEEKDARVLAEIILESENTGFELYSYQSMFSKEHAEMVDTFSKLLVNDLEGHALSYKSFIVAEKEGSICGGICIYKEGVNGSSNHLMTGALLSAFDKKEVLQAFGYLKQFREVDIPKTNGTFQLDSVAVFKEFRGLGIFNKLLKFAEQTICQKGDIIEVQVWNNNTNAISVYQKNNFILERKIDIEGNGRTLLTKTIE